MALVTGVLTAADELALDRELEAMGLALTRAKVVGAKHSAKHVKLSARELVTMTTQLATLLGAGVPILGALQGLAPQMRSEGGQELISRIADSIEGGGSLSEALAQFPDSFSAVYRSSVRAGEMTGALPSVLSSQAKFLEWCAEIRSTTVQALFYPFMLMVAISALIVLMITFLVPRIIAMMPGGEESMPGPTLFLMGLSDLLVDHGVLLAGGLALVVGGTLAALRHKPTATACSRMLLRIPRLGDLLSMLAVSRFARTASTLQDAGCDVLSMIDVSSSACGNKAYQASFEEVRERVAKGDRLSEALEKQVPMDPLLVQMASVGEDTGELDVCLSQLSGYYDKEVPRMVQWFLAILEPAILVCAGGAVAFILLAAILPMLSLYENM